MIESKQKNLGNIILGLILISLFAMLILNVPAWILDIMLMLNIVGTIALLVFCLGAKDSMQLYSFPTLILISTLYRLGLNLSSTRLILSKGDAGAIIETFGKILTSGNMTVGLISFFVLQIIQFLVISKGAERVSEVSARFTLDALPGKQMSIDADLRAGLLQNTEAQKKRKELIQESKFYGSMDGAMKFVKGETIASFIIVAINLIGGVAIGMFDQGYTFSEATQVYGMLSIGDALSAQIPALILSLSAGILVTRVASPTENSSLGKELEEQFLSEPKKIFIIAIGILALAFVPGFPKGIFIVCASLVGGFGHYLKSKKSEFEKLNKSIDTHRVDPVGDTLHLGRVYPLLLVLSPNLYEQFLKDDRWQNCLNQLFPKFKNVLSSKLGVPFPDLKISVNDFLPKDRYVIQIFEVVVDEGHLSAEHCVIPHYPSHLSLDTQAEERLDQTAHGTPIALMNLSKEAQLNEQGYFVLGPEEVLLKHLGQVLKKHAHEFIGIQEIKNILTQVEHTHDELVREVVPRLISIHRLTDVIKRLVEENVPIKDFRLILEILASSHPENKNALTLTEILRLGLKKNICQQYLDSDKTLRLITLARHHEEEILANIQESQGESYLHLDPEKIVTLQNAVKYHLEKNQLSSKEVVIVTQPETRRFLKKIIEAEISDMAVLSYAELMGHLKTMSYGEVNAENTRLVYENHQNEGYAQ